MARKAAPVEGQPEPIESEEESGSEDESLPQPVAKPKRTPTPQQLETLKLARQRAAQYRKERATEKAELKRMQREVEELRAKKERDALHLELRTLKGSVPPTEQKPVAPQVQAEPASLPAPQLTAALARDELMRRARQEQFNSA
jgi:hypothetical protein